VLQIGRAGLLLPPFVVPLAMLVLAARDGGIPIVLAQTFAFLPHAFALVMRALAEVSAEAEQAAELLGASRWTVLRRVTLGLSRPGLVSAAFVILGLCLADVTTPLLLGGSRPLVLAAFIADATSAAAPWAAAVGTAAGGAVTLGALTLGVALAGRTWREAGAPAPLGVAPRVGLGPGAMGRAVLAAVAWPVVAVLLALWVTVPIASLLGDGPLSFRHWARLFGVSARPLIDSVALGLTIAVVGTVLAFAVAWVVERRRGSMAAMAAALARAPVAVAGVVGAVGYLAAFGPPAGDLALVALLVAVWQLPLLTRVAGEVLAGSDRAREQAALSLGADRLTTWRRILLPALNPAALWMVAHGFAAGMTAVGAVVVVAGQGRLPLAVTHMLASASTGSVGAACAVATVLLALAGGATLLGRAAAGRETIPTLLA
jgi:iron(III) transport system permease protein